MPERFAEKCLGAISPASCCANCNCVADISPSLPFRHTLANRHGDFSDWHRGRSHFALWALGLDTPAVNARMAAAQQLLAPFLLDGYVREPHVTLAVCGFPAPQRRHDDDFTAADLDAQLAALRALACAPFRVHIGRRLHSFSSAPWLSVEGADATLHRLHHALRRPALAAHTPPYVPHLTVGLYNAGWPADTVQTAFDRHGAQVPLEVEVRSLCLLQYAASEIGGRLERMGEFDLVEGAWRCIVRVAHCATFRPDAGRSRSTATGD